MKTSSYSNKTDTTQKACSKLNILVSMRIHFIFNDACEIDSSSTLMCFLILQTQTDTYFLSQLLQNVSAHLQVHDRICMIWPIDNCCWTETWLSQLMTHNKLNHNLVLFNKKWQQKYNELLQRLYPYIMNTVHTTRVLGHATIFLNRSVFHKNDIENWRISNE